MKYSFFPGCSMESTAKDFRLSTDAVAKALGITLEEIDGWTCCGSTPAHATDSLLAASLPAKDLAIAEELGQDVVVCCAACYSRLAAANHAILNNPALKAEVSEVIGREYNGGAKVRHFLSVLAEDVGLDEIKDRVEKKLSGMKAACYYGCLLARPRELSIFPDSEDPRLMEDILDAVGVESVEWPYKTECCGASFSITKGDSVRRLTGDILRMAKESGADCIVAACPLCQSNLDLRQADIEKATGEKIGIPVFYFTQLLGLAFGLPEKELGIGSLMVSPKLALGRVTSNQ